ncbi:hypothetical protein [Salinimicrobium sp. HB62]|uniref:hypothetical protein n=1 Tax=Salinimicrobium sp. HB62 TaxID=3077781 RepID=UPI002D79CDF6|nr:hypothetical protein [Salinimicrobium sp. HB62]
MRKFLTLSIAALLLFSCNDGDIIVTDFNFEDPQLSWCGDNQSQVLFKINNSGVNEAIAFRFDLTTTAPQFFLAEEGQVRIPLNSTTNQVVYRVFDGEVNRDYFCNKIPPVSPQVTREFRSTTGGEVIITSTIANATDHDGDGVPSTTENMASEQDTDDDGIPDYLDIDDDGDNILTRVERAVEAENFVNTYPDSDNDGIPDYLDPDDDDDGVPTRNEDWNLNLNPADDQDTEGLAYYLNPAITDSFEVEGVRENSISRSFRYLVTVNNLTLVNQGGDGEQIRLQDYELGVITSPTQNIVLEPTGGENGGEEEEEDQ